MAAMMVHGAKVLRDLIADAKAAGCQLTKRGRIRWNTDYGNYYEPEYLELNGLRAPLPPTNDYDTVIAPEVVEYIWRRLGLDHKVTW